MDTVGTCTAKGLAAEAAVALASVPRLASAAALALEGKALEASFRAASLNMAGKATEAALASRLDR